MKLLLKRVALKEKYTIGKLYIDDVYFCDTLEDKVRDYNKDGDLDEKGEEKIYGETAIPYGKYKVIISYSAKFKKKLPEILNVKGFAGIRIHSGNTPKDTLGCLLVGINDVKGEIHKSKVTFEKLLNKMIESGQEEWDLEII